MWSFDWLIDDHFENVSKLLIIWLYECLTGKNVQTLDGEYNDNFTDARYQSQLPLYARNTASYAIKVSPNFFLIIQAAEDSAQEILVVCDPKSNSFS